MSVPEGWDYLYQVVEGLKTDEDPEIQEFGDNFEIAMERLKEFGECTCQDPRCLLARQKYEAWT